MRIFCLGETLIDIVFDSEGVRSSCPGGAMLNTAVDLGRRDIPVFFISAVGDDYLAEFLLDFLKKNNVDASLVNKQIGKKTGIAIAFLDSQKKASYSFYKDNFNGDFIDEVNFKDDDVLYFGSSFALNEQYFESIYSLLNRARAKGVKVVYDPNYRKGKDFNSSIYERFIKNTKVSDWVKGSDEDFQSLLGTKTGLETWNLLRKSGIEALFYTKGHEGAELINHEVHISIPSIYVDVVSTIGAGDAFSAGVLFEFYRHSRINGNDSILPDQWNKILQKGVEFGAEVCGRDDNFILKSGN